MTAVVFIHGTGVREPGFSALAGRFSAGVTALRGGLRVVPYYWGGEHGAALAAGGASLPPSAGTGRGPAAPGAGDDDTAPWAALYADPYAELDLAARELAPAAELPPGSLSPDQRIRARLGALAAEGDAPAADLGPGLARAATDLTAHPLLGAAAAGLAPDDLPGLVRPQPDRTGRRRRPRLRRTPGAGRRDPGRRHRPARRRPRRTGSGHGAGRALTGTEGRGLGRLPCGRTPSPRPHPSGGTGCSSRSTRRPPPITSRCAGCRAGWWSGPC